MFLRCTNINTKIIKKITIKIQDSADSGKTGELVGRESSMGSF
jgi:hypothetical protein